MTAICEISRDILWAPSEIIGETDRRLEDLHYQVISEFSEIVLLLICAQDSET